MALLAIYPERVHSPCHIDAETNSGSGSQKAAGVDGWLLSVVNPPLKGCFQQRLSLACSSMSGMNGLSGIAILGCTRLACGRQQIFGIDHLCIIMVAGFAA